MKIIIIIIIKNEKKNLYRKNGIWLLPKLYCNTTIALQAARQAGAHRRGRWALGAQGVQGAGRVGQAGAGRRASGSWALGERAQGVGACYAQARCRRTNKRGAQQGRAGRAA